MTCRGCGARPCVNQPHAEECRPRSVEVNVAELGDAIDWLRGFFPAYDTPDDDDMTHARTLLQALGVDR